MDDSMDKQGKADEGSPKFGRLLIVLVLAVILIGVITLSAEAFYS